MEWITSVYAFLMAHLQDILSGAAHLCLLASVIVKLTPTLKDDDLLKPVIKFIGKYVALDKYGPTETK